MKRACLANINKYEDRSCEFPRNSGAGYPALEINYLRMKKFSIGLLLAFASVVCSFGQANPDRFISNCISNTGPDAKYLKDFRIQLGQSSATNDFRFKAKIYLWKDTRYRFTMCTAENSKGQLVMNIRDEENKLVLESSDPETGTIYPFIDFNCSRSGLYQICYDFSERLPGSGAGIISILK